MLPVVDRPPSHHLYKLLKVDLPIVICIHIVKDLINCSFIAHAISCHSMPKLVSGNVSAAILIEIIKSPVQVLFTLKPMPMHGDSNEFNVVYTPALVNISGIHQLFYFRLWELGSQLS
nr:hypothetical protein Iba_chr01dCG13440 [Ipomoea batatas]